MFNTEENVNYILNYSKQLVDSIGLNDDNFRVLKYIIFAGLISYYGFEAIENIYKTFAKTGFIYSKDSPENTICKESKNYSDIARELSRGQIPAYLSCGIEKNSMGQIRIVRNIYIFEKFFVTPDLDLEVIVHEINHVINSINNPICLRNGNKVLRVGVMLNGLEYDFVEGRTLEESINVLQAAEIVEHILEFTQYNIEDKEIARELEKLKYAYGKKRNGYGYGNTTFIIKDLYMNERFNYLLKKHRLSGLIKPIREDFDSKVGCDAMSDFSRVLDEINSKYVDVDGTNKAFEYVKKYNNR